MAFADSNRGQILYVPETDTLGTPVSKGFQAARFTSSDFTANKNTVVSDEIRSDRMVSDVTEVGFTSTGTVNFEFSLRGTYDEFLEAALGGTWTRGNKYEVTKANYSVLSSNRRINITAGTTPTYIAGQKITLEGDAYNKGTYTVESVGSGYIVVVETSLTNVTGISSDGVSSAGVVIYSDEIYADAGLNKTIAIADGAGSTTTTYTFGTAIKVPAEWIPGQWVYVSGCAQAGNNGWKRIVSIDTTLRVVTTAGGCAVAEPTAPAMHMRGKCLRNGTVKRSFLVEQGFTDIGQYFAYYGQRVGTLSLDVSSGATITGSVGFQGTSVARGTTNRSWYNNETAATTSSTVNATSNVGTVYSDFLSGTALTTTIQSLSINIDNALRDQLAVGNKYAKGIGYGRQTVSGSLTAYFEDATLYDKFLNHTSASLGFVIEESDSDAATKANKAKMRVSLPNVKFQTDNPNIGGIDQDVVESVDFTAFAYTYDAPSGTDPVFQIQIDMIPAIV